MIMETAQQHSVKQAEIEDAPPQRLELSIPWMTFVKVAAVSLAAYTVSMLWPLLLLVFLAFFLAVTLHAFVHWLEGKGMRHWASLWIVISGFLAVVGIGIALIIPALIAQVTAFSKNLPQLHEDVLDQLPVGKVMRDSIQRLLDSVSWSEASTWFGHVMSAGGFALGGISQLALLLVIAIYLLIDGRKTFEWGLAFFSPLKRRKLRITAEEVSQVIFGYVSGQITTSLLVMMYSFVVLKLLHVPGALMLAILAGLFDILPMLGFFIATAPAILLALTLSPQTAGLVLAFYLLFQLVENYFIVPMIYGKNLRVSTLTVLLGLLAGALLAGIIGALAALPVIASYAAVERIWLKPFLRDGVSEKHELQMDQNFGHKD